MNFDAEFKKAMLPGSRWMRINHVNPRFREPVEVSVLEANPKEVVFQMGDTNSHLTWPKRLGMAVTLDKSGWNIFDESGRKVLTYAPVKGQSIVGAAESIVSTLLQDAEDSDAWIGVDFDGTLAKYTNYKGSAKLGDPIPKMVARIRRWVGHGKRVKIFTARADDEKSVNAIKKWLKDNEMPDLEITNLKDHHMTELWDDKAVAVKKNTGEVKEARRVNPQDMERALNFLRRRNPTGYAQTLLMPFGAVPSHAWEDPNSPWWSSQEAFDTLAMLRQGATEGGVKGPYECKDFPFNAFILEALEGWEPSPHVLNWFSNMLRTLHPEAKWVVPDTGQVYHIDKNKRTIELISGDPNDPQHWHEKTKLVFQKLGYTMHEHLPENPDEISFAESRLNESPEIKTLKKNARPLDPQERTQVMKAGAVWHHGPNGEATPAVRKAIVNGKTWYWCATHRFGQVRSTLAAAIKTFPAVEETS